MLRDSFNNISIKTVLYSKRAKSSGMYPVKLKVIFKRECRYFGIGMELSERDWDMLPTTKNRELSEKRKDMQQAYDNARSIIKELVGRGTFSFEALSYSIKKPKVNSLNALFAEKISELSSEDRTGSQLYYQYALDTLVKHYGANVSFDAVTVDWLKKYEKKLSTTLGTTSIGMQMRAIRTIINIAKKRMYITENQYPFGEGKYEIKKGASIKKALQIQQIGEIARYKEGSKSLQFYKDMWLFSYLCNGINPADIIKLKYSNIVDNEIVFVRQKTERSNGTVKIIQAPIQPAMQAIIDRWGNEPNSDSYIFPILKGGEDAMQRKMAAKYLVKRIGTKMTVVGKALEIGNISCLTARHSFATVLKRSGANIASISESLGHGDLKTTENYLASFEKEERDKNASMLTNFD